MNRNDNENDRESDEFYDFLIENSKDLNDSQYYDEHSKLDEFNEFFMPEKTIKPRVKIFSAAESKLYDFKLYSDREKAARNHLKNHDRYENTKYLYIGKIKTIESDNVAVTGNPYFAEKFLNMFDIKINEHKRIYGNTLGNIIAKLTYSIYSNLSFNRKDQDMYINEPNKILTKNGLTWNDLMTITGENELYKHTDVLNRIINFISYCWNRLDSDIMMHDSKITDGQYYYALMFLHSTLITHINEPINEVHIEKIINPNRREEEK